MKWRSTALYLAIFLVIGGYFYYFEVVKTERKQAAEKEAKRVFSYDPDSVRAIEVAPAKERAYRLEKQDRWRITEPVKWEIDRTNFDTLFLGLKNLEITRKVGPVAENLERYGLAEQAFKIRFQAGDNWLDLLVGEQNPTGDAMYAKTGSGGDIFLIDQPSWNTLNQGLDDMRKKELFSWYPDHVLALDVEWQTGEKARFERGGETGEWQAAGQPDRKVKAAKLENLLNQMRMTRAIDFPEESARPDPPMVRIVLQLKDGQTTDIALGNPDRSTRTVVATSREVPAPVTVTAVFFDSIPKDAAELIERSFWSGDSKAVREIKWKRAGAEGAFKKDAAAKWDVVESAGSKPLEDPSPILLFLEELPRFEYLETIKAEADMAGQDSNYLELRGADRKLAAISWPALTGETRGDISVRVESEGKTTVFKVKNEDAARLDEAFQDLTAAGRAE